MKNYSSISNGLHIYNNNNNINKNRKQLSNQNRMLSSLDLNKNKGNNINFEPITKMNFNPSQTQQDFCQRRERNSSMGNNMINYYIPKGGSQYNLNMLKKMNNKYERENLNVMKENNINKFYNSSSGLNKVNIKQYNPNNININTSPNDNMDLYEEEENEEEDIENIANEIDEYNNNEIGYNILMQNKILNNHINKLKEENFLMESKGNEIIKVNEELLNENKLLRQKINQLNNYLRNIKNPKNTINNLNANNKDFLLQKLEKENALLKMNYNKILKQQKNVENNTINKNNNIKEIKYNKKEKKSKYFERKRFDN